MFYVAGNNLPCVLSLFDIAVLCRFPSYRTKRKAVKPAWEERGGDDQGGQQLITNALKRLFHMDILSGWIFLPLIIVKSRGCVETFSKWGKIIPFLSKLWCGKGWRDLVI